MYLCILPIQTFPPTAFSSVITWNKLLLKASAHGLGRCCSCNHQERWWGRRQRQRAPSLLFVVPWRSQGEVPWNNDLLHSAIKGAEPRENIRRLNQLFLESSEVLHTQCRSCWHKLCFGKRRGNCPALWLGVVTASCSRSAMGSDLGTSELGRGCHTWGVWIWSREMQVGHQTGLQGYLCTSPALQGQCLALRV